MSEPSRAGGSSPLTLFSVPRPFSGHIGVIQRNALESWVRLRPRPEIILLGDDGGTAEIALELGLHHSPGLPTNQHGTPLVNEIFSRAEQLASSELMGYVNADIVLVSDFCAAVAHLRSRATPFLLVGRRWNVDIKEPIDFSENWEASLRKLVSERGKQHPATGIDYFVYRRGLWPHIPPFALGRTFWDNWLLYDARRRGADLVDASRVVMAVHQNHEYSGFARRSDLWNGEEAMRNGELAGGSGRTMHIDNANWRLGPTGLVPAIENLPMRAYDVARRAFWRVTGIKRRRLPPT